MIRFLISGTFGGAVHIRRRRALEGGANSDLECQWYGAYLRPGSY